MTDTIISTLEGIRERLQASGQLSTSLFQYKTALLSACGQIFMLLEKTTTEDSRLFLKEQYEELQQLYEDSSLATTDTLSEDTEHAAVIYQRVISHLEDRALAHSDQ